MSRSRLLPPRLRAPASAAHRALRQIRAERFVRSVPGIDELTMVGRGSLGHLVRFIDEMLAQGVPGDIVECGVWRGGASFVAARRLAQRDDRTRRVWMFDSYEGLPPPQEVDGEDAKAWAADTEGEWYFDNCTASVEQVEASARALGVEDRTRIVKGWFEDTLPATKAEIGSIAVLRIDGDWYESVKTCLEELYDQVSPGGIVILDDYYLWDGCTIAVHEFLGARALAHRIERAGTAFFWKTSGIPG